MPDQPPPKPGGQEVWPAVVDDLLGNVDGDLGRVAAGLLADIQERQQVGLERYGTPLQTHNGRDALTDAYQEALDLVVYLKQAILEKGDSTPGALHAAYFEARCALGRLARLRHGGAL